jgi:hypothetical protein
MEWLKVSAVIPVPSDTINTVRTAARVVDAAARSVIENEGFFLSAGRNSCGGTVE